MPWLTFGAPGLMTCLHQAHTSVGRRRAALIAFFMIGRLDSMGAGMFRVFGKRRGRLGGKRSLQDKRDPKESLGSRGKRDLLLKFFGWVRATFRDGLAD